MIQMMKVLNKLDRLLFSGFEKYSSHVDKPMKLKKNRSI
jgi:hypothetical protein